MDDARDVAGTEAEQEDEDGAEAQRSERLQRQATDEGLLCEAWEGGLEEAERPRTRAEEPGADACRDRRKGHLNRPQLKKLEEDPTC